MRLLKFMMVAVGFAVLFGGVLWACHALGEESFFGSSASMSASPALVSIGAFAIIGRRRLWHRQQ